MKSILFKTQMVDAILKKGKRQTRRLMTPQPIEHNSVIKMPLPRDKYAKELKKLSKKGYKNLVTAGIYQNFLVPQPFAGIGDIVYVKETWQVTDFLHLEDENYGFIYKASINGQDWQANDESWKWKPSLFMPEVAARLFLKITKIRYEPLCMITESDAILEGVSSVKEYAELWDSINKDPQFSFDKNPAVFVYDFDIHEIKFNDYGIQS